MKSAQIRGIKKKLFFRPACIWVCLIGFIIFDGLLCFYIPNKASQLIIFVSLTCQGIADDIPSFLQVVDQ